MAQVEFQRIKARDGKDLPVWLTLPPDAAPGKPLPSVVMVHGGPWVRGGYRRWQAIEQAALTAASPLAQAARIRAPVLPAFGEKDLRVPLAHGTRMRDALRAAGADPEWVTYTNETHGWNLNSTNIDFARRVERFLAQHLSGAKDQQPRQAKPWRCSGAAPARVPASGSFWGRVPGLIHAARPDARHIGCARPPATQLGHRPAPAARARLHGTALRPWCARVSSGRQLDPPASARRNEGDLRDANRWPGRDAIAGR